jgi:ribosomal protein L10
MVKTKKVFQMQWKKKTNKKVVQEMANSPYQLFLQLVPVQCVTWGLLKHEISTMESSAKLQIVRRSLMKKQDSKALSQTSVMNSHGTTALLTCGSLETFKKIVKNLFFQKNSWMKTQNKPLILVHGKIRDVYVNFYDLQRLSSLEHESLGTLQRIKKPSAVFCAKLQNKNLLFLKLLKASNEN